MNSGELRSQYIKSITQLRVEKHFNEGLYDAIYDALCFQIKQWKSEGVVPIRIFETCIDFIYNLSSVNTEYSESIKEKLNDAQDEIYGLLMSYDE